MLVRLSESASALPRVTAAVPPIRPGQATVKPRPPLPQPRRRRRRRRPGFPLGPHVDWHPTAVPTPRRRRPRLTQPECLFAAASLSAPVRAPLSTALTSTPIADGAGPPYGVEVATRMRGGALTSPGRGAPNRPRRLAAQARSRPRRASAGKRQRSDPHRPTPRRGALRQRAFGVRTARAERRAHIAGLEGGLPAARPSPSRRQQRMRNGGGRERGREQGRERGSERGRERGRERGSERVSE